MKKVFLSLLLAGAVAGVANAQESVGGIPWSTSNASAIEGQKVSLISLPAPDYAKAKAEDELNERIGKPGKYRVALAVNTNINLNNSGTFTYLPNGGRIWRLQVAVPTSLALKINYGDFSLPAGVTYYVQNQDKQQLIGGFDYTSNTPAKAMAHDMVQGDVVNLEMDIQPGADLSKVEFQINQIYGLYRGANRVNHDFGTPEIQAEYGLGEADPCQINAKCPEGANWFTYANAVAHIWITDGVTGGWCSGTLINNTARDCSPLFLTASHCDANNAYSSGNFSQWEFTFNYWTPLCGGGGTISTAKVIKGADFKARSYMTIPAGQESGPLYGDFLLLKIKDPTSKMKNWGLYFAGWDRSGQINDSLWVAFHHPKGDVMKFTKMAPLDATGDFNTNESGTHWAAKQVIGGSEPGSSGSGLWRGSTGMLIGDLSGGSGSACATNRWSLYSKISHNWANTHDTIYYSDSINSVNSSLAAFLDPTNSGVMNMEMGKLGATCPDTIFRYPFGSVGIKETQALENGIAVFPNPSSGKVIMNVNLDKLANLDIEVLNVVGQKVGTYHVNNAGMNQKVDFDFSKFPNGIYLMKVSTPDATITKKIIIEK